MASGCVVKSKKGKQSDGVDKLVRQLMRDLCSEGKQSLQSLYDKARSLSAADRDGAPQKFFEDKAQFRDWLSGFPHNFLVTKTDGGAVWIEPCTTLEVCEAHCSESCSGNCGKLHICKYFLKNSCKSSSSSKICNYGHTFCNPYNLSLLYKNFLDELDVQELKELLLTEHRHKQQQRQPKKKGSSVLQNQPREIKKFPNKHLEITENFQELHYPPPFVQQAMPDIVNQPPQPLLGLRPYFEPQNQPIMHSRPYREPQNQPVMHSRPYREPQNQPIMHSMPYHEPQNQPFMHSMTYPEPQNQPMTHSMPYREPQNQPMTHSMPYREPQNQPMTHSRQYREPQNQPMTHSRQYREPQNQPMTHLRQYREPQNQPMTHSRQYREPQNQPMMHSRQYREPQNQPPFNPQISDFKKLSLQQEQHLIETKTFQKIKSASYSKLSTECSRPRPRDCSQQRSRCISESKPNICYKYNNGKCYNKNCKWLHICFHIVHNDDKSRESCKKNHSINNQVKNALCGTGFDVNRSNQEILKSLRDLFRPKFVSKQTKAQIPRKSVANKSTIICKNFLCVKTECKSKFCKNHHRNLPYQWQYRVGDSELLLWKDCNQFSNNLLEENYCRRPVIQECAIEESNLGGLVKYDFTKMNGYVVSDASIVINVRRLSTVPFVKDPNNPLATEWDWFWQDVTGNWHEYLKSGDAAVDIISETIEEMYLKNSNHQQFTVGARTYVLNFSTMVIQSVLGNQNICRRPRYVKQSEINKKRNLLPGPLPGKKTKNRKRKKGKGKEEGEGEEESQEEGEGDEESQEEGEEERQGEGEEERQGEGWKERQGEGEEEREGEGEKQEKKNNFPPNWIVFDLTDDLYAHNEVIELQTNSKEYKMVKDLFLEGLPQKREKLIAIQRIENGFLWDEFTRRRDAMKRRSKSKSIAEELLFHGTHQDSVDSISNQGFDCRLSGDRVGTLYGRGCYFAKSSKYANLYVKNDGESNMLKMFLARVLIGDYCVGQSSYKRPPLKDNTSGDLFNSCVDNIADPKLFVIFQNDQCYPEYIITYEES